MPMGYMLIAINGDDRYIVCLYDTREEADRAEAQESFWLDQGMYGPDDADTVVVVEEIELPDTEEEAENA